MMILDGRLVREKICDSLREKISKFSKKPHLAILQIGSRADSGAYVSQKIQFGESIGAKVTLIQFEESIEAAKLGEEIEALNNNPEIDGVIIQLPLPKHLDASALLEQVSPQKDVDGLTAFQSKLLRDNNSAAIIPATARGIFLLLEHYNIDVSGKHVVVVGRSRLVGRPVADLALNRGATVTVCHRGTKPLADYTKQADILIVAAGVPGLITRYHVRSGQVVVDVGINPVQASGGGLLEELPRRKLVGDVLFDEVKEIVTAISPVPGGVGPMTVASLFENLLDRMPM